MKLINLLPIAILALVLSVTLVSAVHIPQVLLNPSEWTAMTDRDISLSVKNTNGDNIVQVELFMPLNADGSLVYTVNAIARPAGWTYIEWPNRIVWTTAGAGLGVNDAVDFSLNVRSPASGQYQWSWATTDVSGGTFSGTSTTKISMAPVSYFRIDGVPASVMAGNSFKVTVRVYSSDDTLKTDYAGTVSFTSSDTKAIIPKDYTFSASDKGVKEFYLTYKTAGDQTLTVTDWSSKITQKSAVTKVEPGYPTSIAIAPDNAEVNPKGSVVFKTTAKDKFDNMFEVTSGTKWSIDSEAGGVWNANVYTSESSGLWTVTAAYAMLSDGTSLTVKEGAAVTPVPEVPEEAPTKPEETPVVTPTPVEEMNIETQSTVTVMPGANETFIVTVNNVGSKDLTDVSLSTMNVPSEWLAIYPSKISIEAGTSRDFLIVVSVPENTTENVNMDIVANSNEGVTAKKTVEISVATAPTGLLGLSKNLLNLGIVIVAVAALVLIAWELWFRKPKPR